MSEKIAFGNIAGLEASRIFFGMAAPPVSTDEESAYTLLDGVLDSGINTFDCARSYGKAENALGKWLESRKCRDKVIILSKCGDVKNGVVKVSRQVILNQLQQSLEALRVNCIDIYLLHRDDPNTPVEEFIDTLNELKDAGRIKVFGVSNWTHQRIESANNYAASKKNNGLSGIQPELRACASGQRFVGRRVCYDFRKRKCFCASVVHSESNACSSVFQFRTRIFQRKVQGWKL